MKSFIKTHYLIIIGIFIGLFSLPIFIYATVYPIINHYKINPNNDYSFLPVLVPEKILSDHTTILPIYADISICLTNDSDNTYYIPNKTVTEWTSWMNAITSGSVNDSSGRVEVLREVCNNGYCQTELLEDCGNSTDCGTCAVPPATYKVFYTAEANGALIGDTEQEIEPGGSGTQVFADANLGYSFDRWGGTPIGDGYANPRIDTNVNEGRALIAEFMPYPCSDGLCDYDCPSYCPGGVYKPYGEDDPITGEPPAGIPDDYDSCSYGYCASQCPYNCPGGYYDPSGWLYL
jgi:hypothetical protein